MTQDLEKVLNEFKLSHYKNADFDSLTFKTVQLCNNLELLKDKKKRNRVILETYTLYLQAIEILFINSYALSVKTSHFPSALFINSYDLRKFIEDNFKKTSKISDWFLTKVVLALFNKNNGHEERFNLYSNLLREVAQDYLGAFELLNAYKHGYRVNAKHDKTVLSIVMSDNRSFKLDESDSNIVYLTKEKISNGELVIFEHTLYFKVSRVFGKCLFVCSLLNNTRAAVLRSHNEKIKSKEISSFSINDKKFWGKSFGESHFKKSLFRLNKT